MTGTSRAPEPTGQRVTLGVRTHSGWAAYVVLTGKPNAPTIVARGRMELCDGTVEGSKQPFHTAEPMTFAKAQAFIEKCRASSAALADRALASLIRETGAPSACCQLAASGRPLPDLKSILASHSLIHAAEGEFYRDILDEACGRIGIRAQRVRERDMADAVNALPVTEATRKLHLEALGKQVGPPWTQDEKLATLAAWLMLAGRPSKARAGARAR